MRGTFLIVFLLAWGAARSAEATPPPAIAMVANHGSASVTVFDMNTDTVLGSVAIGSGEVLDCSLDGQTNLGYVGDFSSHIWAVDAGASPPVLAAGTNPIGTSIETEDTAITADRRFLLSCDGSIFRPVSVIDLTTRTQVSTFQLPGSCTGVEACADGSVLTVENGGSIIRRLTIDAAGTLTDTGEALSLSSAFNVVCGKGGKSGVVISQSGIVQSFAIPGLVPLDTRTLSSGGIAGVVNGAGDRFYARGFSTLDVFSFDSTTGALGTMPLLTIAVSSTGTFYGVDQLAVNPAGTKLYVSESNAVNVYDTTSGVRLTSITDASIAEPTGICAVRSICGNGVQEGGEACDDGNLDDGDGCDSNCTLTACGNGVVTAGEECDDGNLTDGDCCSSTCTAAPDATPCDDRRFCNGADTCASGACTQHAGDPCAGGAECSNVCNEAADSCATSAGTLCTDDGNACTLDQCDGMGMCVHPDNDFSPCDDGLFCNGGDFCFGGSCTFHDGNPCSVSECISGCDELAGQCDPTSAGLPCSDDGNVCTADVCDGAGGCVHPPAIGGIPCPDDGNVCTMDKCDGAGSCYHPPGPSGIPCPDDGNECTHDQCDDAGTCAHPAVPDGAVCDDSNACTQTDRCQSGHCAGSNPVICPAPLCRQTGTCDPSNGACTSCPTGYVVGGGGCQKTYAIDTGLLINQDSFCDAIGANRYNGCTGPFGFHWTDTGDARVGPVIRVDVEVDAGINCGGGDRTVALNQTPIGVYASTAAGSCACLPPVVPKLLPDVDPSSYVKGGPNVVSIDTTDCAGLSQDADGDYAIVTVTYHDPGLSLAPRTGCQQAAKSTFRYKNNANDALDKMKWKWGKGDATTQAELGDPTASADYQLCIFGEMGSTPTLLIGANVPASATLWSAVGSTGYKYDDAAASQDGMKAILLHSGAAGKAKLLVNGQGAALGDPSLPLSLATTGIRAQLTNQSSGVCWESEFPLNRITADDQSIRATVR